MNIDRDTDQLDELVSETYRELNVVRTPEHLNQAVLRMASDRASPGGAYRRLIRAWMKPVALAATIALSLAMLLEFSELPSQAVRPDATATDRLLHEESISRDRDRLQKAKNQAKLKSSSNQQSSRREAPVIDSSGFTSDGIHDPATTTACSKVSRQSADDWLICIATLRESGAIEAADREYEAFILEYPVESVDSDTNK